MSHHGDSNVAGHMALAARGDLWLILHQQRSRLITAATRWGMSQQDAEDAASEAIVRAATYLRLDPTRIDQFLFTMLRRIYVDDVRRAARSHRAFPKIWSGLTQESGEAEIIGALTVAALLVEARLSLAEARIVVLVTGGYCHADIGARLGITTHASELGLARARSKLKLSATDPSETW